MFRPALPLRLCLFSSIQNFELPLLPRVFPPMTTSADLEFCFSLVFYGTDFKFLSALCPSVDPLQFFFFFLFFFFHSPNSASLHLTAWHTFFALSVWLVKTRSTNYGVIITECSWWWACLLWLKKAGLPRRPFPSKVCGLTSSERLHVFHRHEGNTIKSF